VYGQRGKNLKIKQDTWGCSIAALLLVLMGLLAGGAARRESVTIDEVAHTAAGVSYWQQLDMRMNEEHPPRAKLLAAVPLVIRRAHADYSHLSWTWSAGPFHQFLGEWVFGHWFLMRWNNPRSTLFWARLPMLLVTLILGLVLYICGSGLGGVWGGLLCLTAYVSMPAFLAFGPLVVTDVVVTLFWVLTVWQLPAMWHSPSRRQVIKFGLAFAGALLSKFSSGLLLFVFPAVAVSMRFWPLPEQPAEKVERRAWRRSAWRNLIKGTLWAALFVYLVYLIFSWHQSTDSFNLIPHFPKSQFLRRLLMPVMLYVRGLLVFALSAGSRPTFILGHTYSHGVWFYFPILFILKSQLAFLLLLLLTLLTAVTVRRRRDDDFSIIPAGSELHWRSVWVSLVIYVAACMLNRLDISIRHFLIPLGLIILLLAPLPRMLELLRRSRPMAARIGAAAAIALAAVALVTAIRAYPYYFPFLNSFSLGQPGYALVNDSNLDWNQALPDVEKFVRHRGLNQVLLDEWGFSDPTVYVPQAQWWDCQTAASSGGGQWAVLSANMIEDGHNCRWLLQYPHQVLAAGGMYAFQLPETIPAAGEAGGPPLPKDYRYFGGFQVLGEDPRVIFWDCIRDPQQLQPTFDRFVAMTQSYSQKK
jgi:Dolichyl-phosphate-mannose-protein mannosyltransferase